MTNTSTSCPARLAAYDPYALGGGAVVPYIARWSGEEVVRGSVIRRPEGGIGYADETVLDRDQRGVLWARTAGYLGVGRPLFTKVHPVRQRHAMLRLLCQVCARPADHRDEGTLWLVPGIDPAGWDGWRPGMATIHPPLCRACARTSVRTCPGLRSRFVALRADSRVCGVTGVVYQPAGLLGLSADNYPHVIRFDDPAIAWTQALQLARVLVDVRTIDLELLS